jgi:hypothetical protein
MVADSHKGGFNAPSSAASEARQAAKLRNNFVMDRNDEIYIEQLSVLEGKQHITVLCNHHTRNLNNSFAVSGVGSAHNNTGRNHWARPRRCTNL